MGLCFSNAVMVFACLGLFNNLAQAQYDVRANWLRLHISKQANEMKLCRSIHEEGVSWGKIAYAQAAPDCVSYFLNASYMARSTDSLDIFLSKPETGSHAACYRSGWYLGYLSAHENLWGQCEAQLDEVRNNALQKRVDHCRSVADMVRADSTTLGEFLYQTTQGEAQIEAELLRKKIFTLVAIGESEKAWQQVLDEEKNEEFSTLPCQVALAQALANGVKP